MRKEIFVFFCLSFLLFSGVTGCEYTPQEKNQHYIDGFKAYRIGLQTRDNPYAKNSEADKLWNRGWVDAKLQDMEKQQQEKKYQRDVLEAAKRLNSQTSNK